MKETAIGPVRFIPGPNRGKYPHCHSVYIEDDGILIDPASARGRLREIRDREGVREVWLTHWHEDHFMHLDLFEGVPLRIHPADAPPLADMDAFLDAYAIENTTMRNEWAAIVREMFHFQERSPAAVFGENETVRLSSVTVEVISTPGHTPGHLCFFFREPGVLFLGDYDLTPFGPWYGDRDSSISDTVASIERLRRFPATTWLSCHETGLFREAPPALWDAYLEVIRKREKALTAYLKQPRTMDDIIDQWIVYRKPRQPERFYRFLEGAIMGKHLTGLMADGRVEQTGSAFVLRRT